MVWLSGFLERWSLRLIVFAFHAALVLAGCYVVIWWIAHDLNYDRIEDVPKREAGLVLGCVRKIGAYENQFFNERVNAAAALYEAGKVEYLIVSGDNHKNGYDEPTDLKAALIKKGVPAKRIYCDYAGFRTLDSVVRAKRIFTQDDCIIISQKFHNERALYIARRNGMYDAVAFNARDLSHDWMAKMYLREIFARVLAVLDVEVFGTTPKLLGEKIYIGANSPPVDAE